MSATHDIDITKVCFSVCHTLRNS